MMAIAVFANAMFGYGARRRKAGAIHMLVLPLVLSIAFFLIADIDSPRRGVIRKKPAESDKPRTLPTYPVIRTNLGSHSKSLVVL